MTRSQNTQPEPTLSLVRWTALHAELGVTPNTATFEKLVTLHAEPHRAYHTADHIAACLQHLDNQSKLASRPDLIEAALWFHDAIYNPKSKTNEADSADMAEAYFKTIGLSNQDITHISDMIRATASHAPMSDPDTQLMLDIDMSILGQAPGIYDQYCRDIRTEYRKIPGILYHMGRRRVLKSFLTMPQIFGTHSLREIWEAQARENISRELKTLSFN